VLDVADMPAGFNARWGARGKIYRYQNLESPGCGHPAVRRDSWHVFALLDVHAMREAAALLCGEHDFRAFRAADCERRTTVGAAPIRRTPRRWIESPARWKGRLFSRTWCAILVGTWWPWATAR